MHARTLYLGRAVTAPFERLRTMMMADARNSSLVGTARRMWASGGLPGLWRGNMCSVVKVVPQSAIQFAVRASGWCGTLGSLHSGVVSGVHHACVPSCTLHTAHAPTGSMSQRCARPGACNLCSMQDLVVPVCP